MRRFVSHLAALMLICLGTASQAQYRHSDSFDPQLLSKAEMRYLQAALVLESGYSGALDGVWGKGSQAALDGYAQIVGRRGPARVSDVRRLLLRFGREVRASGWQVQTVPGRRLSHLVPEALLSEDPRLDIGALVSAEGDLAMRYFEVDEAQSRNIHGRLEGAHISAEPALLLRRETVWITGVETIDGKSVYLRSDRLRDNSVVTRYVQSEGAQTARGRLIAASLRRGESSGLALPEGGYLDTLVNDWPPRPAPVPTPDPGPTPTKSVAGPRIGTGFFVNNTDIVTSGVVLDGCATVVLANGDALQLVAKGGPANLALLQSPTRRAGWFILSTSSNMPDRALVSSFSAQDNATPDLRQAKFQGLPRYLRREDQAAVSGSAGTHVRGAPLVDDRGILIAMILGQSKSRVNVGGLRVDVNDVTYVAKNGAIRAFLDGAQTQHQIDAFHAPAGAPLEGKTLSDRTAALFCAG